MRNNTKKIIIGIVLLSITAAICIHIAFIPQSDNPWIYAKWTAGELLTYIGTISLGVIAIWQNGKMEQINQDANEMNILSKAIEYEMSKKKKREELLEVLQANYNVDEILAQIVRVEENEDEKPTALFDIQIRINSSTSAVNYEIEDDNSQECIDLKNAISVCSGDINRLLNKLFSNKIESCRSDIPRLKSNVERFVEKKNCYCKKKQSELDRFIYSDKIDMKKIY